MKTTLILGPIVLMALSSASAIRAQSVPVTVFTCAIGNKIASVTQADGRITYHYGAGGKDEMTIVGTPISGNVFQLSQRFAGWEHQLRFTNGEYSYIVYDSEGNGHVGAASSSGLIILQGAKQISDRQCKRYAEFAVSLDSLGIPEDTDAYSAL
jgi:hypothetical protein